IVWFFLATQRHSWIIDTLLYGSASFSMSKASSDKLAADGSRIWGSGCVFASYSSIPLCRPLHLPTLARGIFWGTYAGDARIKKASRRRSHLCCSNRLHISSLVHLCESVRSKQR